MVGFIVLGKAPSLNVFLVHQLVINVDAMRVLEAEKVARLASEKENNQL